MSNYNIDRVYNLYYELTKENILSRVSQLEIFRHFIPGFKVNTTILSPFGEKNPSFWTRTDHLGNIYFQDFGQSRGSLHGDCFNLVMYLFNASYTEALEIINREMNLNLGVPLKETEQKKQIELLEREKPISQPVEIHLSYIPGVWNLNHDYYWLSHGCNLYLTRVLYGIDVASHFFVSGNIIETPIHSYVWQTKPNSYKFYRPFLTKKKKWKSSLDSNILQGEIGLDYENSKTVIIQSSLKDIICVQSQIGIPGIAASSENAKIPKEKLEMLESKFDRILVLYDNDDTGIVAAEELVDEHKYENIVLPKINDNPKDPSEFYRKGYQLVLKEVFKKHRLI